MASILISYQCMHDGWWGVEKGVGEKTEGGPNLVHNKYNTTFLGSGRP